MIYRLIHATTYTYADPVALCHNEVHLTPREATHQVCRSHRLTVTPEPATSVRRIDYFGNPLTQFSIESAHDHLSLRAVSKIEVMPIQLPNPEQTPPWEQVRDRLRKDLNPTWLDAYQFAFESPDVNMPPELLEFARQCFPPGCPILVGLKTLTARIYDTFEYDSTATHVRTRVDEAFAIKRGVCQDFSHIQIGCLRSLGLAARYVSGYLRTIPPPGKPRLVGADASHAWVSAFCGELGWIDVDPTNNLVCATDHITLAWGRDYGDVCPIKGVFIGGGRHTMTVSVDVLPLTEAPRP